MGQVYGERWEIVRDLGQGGQGQAFLVKDRNSETAEQYVLKRLINVKRSARFEKEVEAIAKLNHPNVLRLVDSDVKAEPRPYLVTEYCRRGSLEENKAAILEFELDQVMGLFEKILAGVSHIHDAKIVHRDIKPANIFLREDGAPVVGDFGLAYIEETERPTETLEAVGARWYMAPELADGRLEEVTPRADVYSLGKLLYWLLTGNIFDRERHRSDRNNILKYYSDETMENVNLLLDKMIVEDYRARYADAGTVAGHFTALRRLVRGGYPSLTAYPRLCRYCGRDVYEKLDSEGTALRNMGISAVSGSRWSMFRCNTCGHLLVFYNDVWSSKAKPLADNLQ
ncbi:MAG TPA: serine/threonine-protein kinase [Thermoanaerobaculia bacterium]|nr:serine/threonine-protein kinase [Thermoanaerobaculia bacterium]